MKLSIQIAYKQPYYLQTNIFNLSFKLILYIKQRDVFLQQPNKNH